MDLEPNFGLETFFLQNKFVFHWKQIGKKLIVITLSFSGFAYCAVGPHQKFPSKSGNDQKLVDLMRTLLKQDAYQRDNLHTHTLTHLHTLTHTDTLGHADGVMKWSNCQIEQIGRFIELKVTELIKMTTKLVEMD